MENIQKKEGQRLLSIYYTAGYPTLDSTLPIAKELANAGADFLEIGFPYSDPVADGPVIQHSSEQALINGMCVEKLFEQLKDLRQEVKIPVFLMGYFNPVLQYGVQRFCEACKAVGVQGVIIPDLPISEYEDLYADIFKANNLSNIFIVTPQTSEDRILKIDKLSTSFIYLLSSNSVTGSTLEVGESTAAYFQRIQDMNLKNPLVIGFGIATKETFDKATDIADGAIIGTAFVRQLASPNYMERIKDFIEEIKG
ncbi:tryptophan synthase subunit alpha [Sphingobacteriaceae bacterium WQ 2009]|uniref:Tryptophan synthase alpha chain n=1 Tax=Rhinopithecimicrobium faecis TaxID=2820698 RepID=A0A8T4H8G3_9SPHI|nr:tryptophan synthase subunit alpha [Sphingobacteriaceae bacterium WQ 2009]